MPIGLDAFNQLAGSDRPDAVISLAEREGGQQGEYVLRTHSRGFQRVIRYFRSAENRYVAGALAQSMHARYGTEVADCALAENNFGRFLTFGKPLHIRRVRAVVESAEQEQASIKRQNHTVKEMYVEGGGNAAASELLRQKIEQRARAGSRGARHLDEGFVARRVETALERKGGDGFHRLTQQEASRIVDAVIGRVCGDTESECGSRPSGLQRSGSGQTAGGLPRSFSDNSFDSIASGSHSRSPSIDLPLNFAEYERIPQADGRGEGAGRRRQPVNHAAAEIPAPVHAPDGGTGQELQSPNVDTGAAETAEPVGEQHGDVGLERQSPATAGAAIEPWLEGLYQSVQEDLRKLARYAEDTQSSAEEIRQTVEAIRLAIGRTMFNAQCPPGQPPAGRYYCETIDTCWRFLLSRCDSGIAQAVRRSVTAYDDARMDSMYQSVRPALQALLPASATDAAVPDPDSLGSIEHGIRRAGAGARVPVRFGEAEYMRYWQYLLKRQGPVYCAALAASAEARDGYLRATVEGANWYRDVFLPLSRKIHAELASLATTAESRTLAELQDAARRVALATGDEQLKQMVGSGDIKNTWQHLLERHGDRLCAALAVRLARQPDAAERALAPDANCLGADALAALGTGELVSETAGELMVGVTGSYLSQAASDQLNGLLRALRASEGNEHLPLRMASRRPELLGDGELATLRNLSLRMPAPDRRGHSNVRVPVSLDTRQASLQAVDEAARELYATANEDPIVPSSRALFRWARFSFEGGPPQTGAAAIVEGLNRTCAEARPEVLSTVTAFANETALVSLARAVCNAKRPDLGLFGGEPELEWQNPMYELCKEGREGLKLTLSSTAVVRGLDLDGGTDGERALNPDGSSLNVRMTVHISGESGSYRFGAFDVGYALETMQAQGSAPAVAAAVQYEAVPANASTPGTIAPQVGEQAANDLEMEEAAV